MLIEEDVMSKRWGMKSSGGHPVVLHSMNGSTSKTICPETPPLGPWCNVNQRHRRVQSWDFILEAYLGPFFYRFKSKYRFRRKVKQYIAVGAVRMFIVRTISLFATFYIVEQTSQTNHLTVRCTLPVGDTSPALCGPSRVC